VKQLWGSKVAHAKQSQRGVTSLTGLTGVRRPPPANEGAGLTGLTGLTGVRRSVHPVGMQGRVRRFVERAHAQGRSVHPVGMQGRVRRSVGRVGLTRPHRPVSLGACESCREGAPQGLHWKARGYYRAPMRLPPKAVQVHMKSGALDGVELFQNCCN
jgi:hypothetical protein